MEDEDSLEKGKKRGKSNFFQKKVKKRAKKVLTKGGWRGIIIELSESGTPERSDRHPNGELVREASRG